MAGGKEAVAGGDADAKQAERIVSDDSSGESSLSVFAGHRRGDESDGEVQKASSDRRAGSL